MPRRRCRPLRRLHRPVGPDRLRRRHLPAIHRPVQPASTPTPATTSPPPASRPRPPAHRHLPADPPASRQPTRATTSPPPASRPRPSAPTGTYQPSAGQSACTTPTPATTSAPPASLADRVRGRHLPAVHRPVLLPDADAGHYVASTGQSAQTECASPPAPTSPSAGQSAPRLRRRRGPLRRLPRAAATTQVECAAGTYQPSPPASPTSCTDAPTTGPLRRLHRPVRPRPPARPAPTSRPPASRAASTPTRATTSPPPASLADRLRGRHLPAVRRPVRLPRRRRGPLRRPPPASSAPTQTASLRSGSYRRTIPITGPLTPDGLHLDACSATLHVATHRLQRPRAAFQRPPTECGWRMVANNTACGTYQAPSAILDAGQSAGSVTRHRAHTPTLRPASGAGRTADSISRLLHTCATSTTAPSAGDITTTDGSAMGPSLTGRPQYGHLADKGWRSQHLTTCAGLDDGSDACWGNKWQTRD